MKDGTVKLADFGVSRILDSASSIAKTYIGTPYYLSPEIVMGKKYKYETDIWSLGILLFEMCALEQCFGKCSNIQELTEVII